MTIEHKNSESWDELFSEMMNDDPKLVEEYIQAAFEAYVEDGNREWLLGSLRKVTKAKGGYAILAKKTQMSRQRLHQVLTGNVTPRLDTFVAIVKGLGFSMHISHC